MTNSIDGVIDAALAGKKIVGCEVTVLKDGKTVYRRAAGHFDREDGVAMPKNAIYLLASVTKPIVAAAALALVDKGVIALDDPVAKHLPYFTPTFRDEPAEITIHHLLTHTSGLAYAFPEDPSISTGLGPSELGFEENFSRVAQHKLLFAPGTGWSYSVAIDVLGALLSRVTGKSLQDVVAEHVTGPLGMRETGFFVADAARLAKPYADAEPEPVVMRDPHELLNDRDEIVRFSPSRIVSQKAFQSGGAGMAGDAGGSDHLLRGAAHRWRRGAEQGHAGPRHEQPHRHGASRRCRAALRLFRRRGGRPAGGHLPRGAGRGELGRGLRAFLAGRPRQRHHLSVHEQYGAGGLHGKVPQDGARRRLCRIRLRKSRCASPPGTSTASRRGSGCC
jgi:CubicO group peptidase (beta-lactamase class C family)